MALEQLAIRVAVVVDDDHLVSLASQRLVLERVQQPPEAEPPGVGGDDDADLGALQAPAS